MTDPGPVWPWIIVAQRQPVDVPKHEPSLPETVLAEHEEARLLELRWRLEKGAVER